MSLIKKILRPRGAPPAPEPRIFAYCASNIGLGHYGRLVRALAEVRRRAPEVQALLATDARETSAAEAAGIKILRLPGFRFLEDGSFKERPEADGITNEELRDARARSIAEAAERFAPDLLFADTNPHGKRDELLAALKAMRSSGRARSSIMLRDIPCPPGEAFKLNGDPGRIRKHAAFYDRILVAGDPGFFDVAAEYAWDEGVRAKLRYLGFVIPPAPPAEPARARESGERAVLASFGGGWEAETLGPKLIEGFAKARAAAGGKLALALVVGPALAPASLDHLRKLAAKAGGAEVERSLPDFDSRLRACDLAILHAGSTPFQILETDIPMALTCREYKSREQDERAERLARWPGIRRISGEELARADCAEWIARGLAEPRVARKTGFKFDGIARAADELLALLAEARAEV